MFSSIWRQMIEELWTSAYRQALTQMSGVELKDCAMVIGFRRYNLGHCHRPHTDEPSKALTHLLFFNEQWSNSTKKSPKACVASFPALRLGMYSERQSLSSRKRRRQPFQAGNQLGQGLYLNLVPFEQWPIDWGGCLRILLDGKPESIFQDIAPLNQFSAVIVRSDNSWQMVTPVASTALQCRLALRIAFFHNLDAGA
ncbi:hypothetical protein [Nostoc sp.]|uniref:hypothetical protein n=1 Tax=Nostoc sp. TaxID=1180 RepID=UPI002FFB9FD6